MGTSIARQSIAELGGSSSVLQRQRADHARLDVLMRQAAQRDGDAQQAVLEDICRLVFPHAFAEESVLWPAARRALPDGPALTLRIEQEHQQVNELVTQLERSRPGDPGRAALLARVFAVLDEDVRDEEDLLLPRLQEVLGPRALRRLGWTWELVRRVAPTRAHPVVARRPPGNVLAALPLSLIDRTRDLLDRVVRRRVGLVSSTAELASTRLAGVAGLVERLPPFTRGEHPSTHHDSTHHDTAAEGSS
jgi:hemerythrin superfamily protein